MVISFQAQLCGVGVAKTGDASIAQAAARVMILKETISSGWIVVESGDCNGNNVCTLGC